MRKILVLTITLSSVAFAQNDGLVKTYYPSGALETEGNYANGVRDGLWTFWYDNNVIASEYFYDNKTVDGKIMEWHIDKECWDRDGNECECGESWWSECEEH